VRELKSAVEQALLLAAGAEITPADLFGGAQRSSTPLIVTRGAGLRWPRRGRGGDAGVGSFRTAKEARRRHVRA